MKSFIVVMLLAGGVTPAAAAQQLPERLTVEDALRIARANNPAHQKTLNDAQVASAEVRQSYAALLPNASANLGFDGSSQLSQTAQNDFGEVVDNDSPEESQSSAARQGVSFSMTLFDGGAMFRQIGAARAQADFVDATIAAARSSLEAKVRRAYFNAQRAEQLIELEARLLASARDRLARSEELFRIAASSQVDVLGARVDVAVQEQEHARARDDARKARLTLLQEMGIEPRETSLLLVDSAAAAFDPATLDVPALVGLALQANPLVLQRRAAIEAAESRASAARASRWPTISADGGWSRSGANAGFFDSFGNVNPTQNRSYSFGLSASLPLFTNLQTSTRVAQAHANVLDAEWDERATRLDVERRVRSAVIDLENAFRSLELANQRAELSRQRLEMMTEQYRLGSEDFLSLQRVIDETSTAERQALEARFNFVTARIALEEEIGAPMPE